MIRTFIIKTETAGIIHLNGPMSFDFQRVNTEFAMAIFKEVMDLGFIHCRIYRYSGKHKTLLCRFNDTVEIAFDNLDVSNIDENQLVNFYKYFKDVKNGGLSNLDNHLPIKTFWLFDGDLEALKQRSADNGNLAGVCEQPMQKIILNSIDRIPLMGNNVEPISAKRDSDIWTEEQIENWVKSHGLHLSSAGFIPLSDQPIPPQKDFRQKGFSFYVVEGAGKTQPYTSKNYRTKFFTNPQGQKGYEVTDLVNGGVLKLVGNNKENIAFMIGELSKLKSLTLKGVSVIDCSCLEKDFPQSDSGKNWYLDNVTVRGKFYLVGRVYLSDITIVGGSHIDPYIIGKGKE